MNLEASIPIPIVLDTDIGTDPDDAPALLLALASPEVALRGVTTVDGDAGLRARIAARLLDGRWAGRDAPIQAQSAPAWLVAEARRAPFHLVAVGPLTNVAAALRLDREYGGRLLGLTVMGGVFDPAAFASAWRAGFAALGREAAWWDHNTASDLTAALACARAGVPTTWVTAERTLTAPLRATTGDRLAAVGPLGAALGRLLAIWRDEWFWRTLPPFAGAAPLPADTTALLHGPLALAALFPGPWLTLRRVPLAYAIDGDLFRLREVVPEAADMEATVLVGDDPAGFDAFVGDRLARWLAVPREA